MYIGRDDDKNNLSHIDFTRLYNVISRFPELSIDILTNGITFTLSYSTRAFKQRKKFLNCLEKYVNQIDTRIYGDYTITDHLFFKDSPIKRASDMRVICDHIFQRHHKQTRKILIPLCKN